MTTPWEVPLPDPEQSYFPPPTVPGPFELTPEDLELMRQGDYLNVVFAITDEISAEFWMKVIKDQYYKNKL